MVMARWTGVVQDAGGNAIAGASIEVRREGDNALVPLFSDRDGEDGLSNPFTADAATVFFHVAGGSYRIKATKGPFEQEWRYVAIGTAGEVDAEAFRTVDDRTVDEQDFSTDLALHLVNNCASRSELKSIEPGRYVTAYLNEPGREGMFKWTTGNFASIVAADTQEGIYIASTIIPATTGAWVRVISGPIRVTWFGASNRGDADASPGIQAAMNFSLNVFFPPGQYNIHTSLQARNNHRLTGAFPQSEANAGVVGRPANGSEVVLYGTLANLGAGKPILKLSPVDVANTCIVIENLTFYGDTNVDPTNLEGSSVTGIIGVELDHVKNGLEFIQCAFRNLRHGVEQNDEEPYLDKVTFSRCHFHRVALAVEGKPTAGFSFDNCWFYECRSFIDANQQDVLLVGCSFNNSSYSSNAKVRARKIVMIGGYIEGPTHMMIPKQYLKMDGVVTWSAKIGGSVPNCLVVPANNTVTIIMEGVSMAANMRLISFAAVSAIATIWLSVTGQGGDGTGFAEGSDSIATYTSSGLKFRGFGNHNNSGWNTSFG